MSLETQTGFSFLPSAFRGQLRQAVTYYRHCSLEEGSWDLWVWRFFPGLSFLSASRERGGDLDGYSDVLLAVYSKPSW